MTRLEQLQSDFERADRRWAELVKEKVLDIRAIRSAKIDLRKALAGILKLRGETK
jgi:hypothetical protein